MYVGAKGLPYAVKGAALGPGIDGDVDKAN